MQCAHRRFVGNDLLLSWGCMHALDKCPQFRYLPLEFIDALVQDDAHTIPIFGYLIDSDSASFVIDGAEMAA